MRKNSGLAQQRLGTCAALLTALIVIASVCAAGAGRWWIADLAVHFPVQYMALAAAAFLVLVWVKRPVWAVVALLASGYNATAAAPWIEHATHPPAPDAKPYRFVSINVLFHNRDYAAVSQLLRSLDADVAVLEEITPTWRAALAPLDQQYPYRYATEGPRQRGVLLLSRWPLQQTTTLALGNDEEPAIHTFVQLGSRRLEVIGVHASWPMGERVSEVRDVQLGRLAAVTRERRAPLVVLGDLNVSPFSPHFHALLAQGGVRSAAQGFGWQPTWPSLFLPGAIQIDHALVSPDIKVRSFRCGPFVGSDHRPIITDLVLEPARGYSAARSQ